MQKNKTRHTSRIGPIILIAIGLVMILFTIWSLIFRDSRSSSAQPQDAIEFGLFIPMSLAMQRSFSRSIHEHGSHCDGDTLPIFEPELSGFVNSGSLDE
jgi:hypothetical protein